MSSTLHHKWSFLVLESHLDTFGHMNHATYLQLFEQARWDLLTSRGFGLNEITQQQIGPTILEVNVKYRRELRLREEVTIETHSPKYSGKIGKIQQRMLNSTGKESASIELTIGLFDMKARKLIPPTLQWLKAIGLED